VWDCLACWAEQYRELDKYIAEILFLVDVILVVNVTYPCCNHDFFHVVEGGGLLLEPTIDTSVSAAASL